MNKGLLAGLVLWCGLVPASACDSEPTCFTPTSGLSQGAAGTIQGCPCDPLVDKPACQTEFGSVMCNWDVKKWGFGKDGPCGANDGGP